MNQQSDRRADERRLGRYELLSRLAVGGMAEIYLARAQGLSGFEKLLVLKRILPQHALDPQLLRMFMDEARLTATLTHPHITQVYDVGTQDDTPFFTMEYVHGANLRELLNAEGRRGPGTSAGAGGALPDAHAVAIIAAAAAGLHYAHEKTGADGQPLHIVHRDVSPSNVLITYDGAIKVTDFGIAKWASQRTQTQAGAIKGKFAYMSPEQCRGLPVDRRSDVFALGTLLYELTTGAAPFRGDSDYEILNHIVNDPPPPPQRPGDGYPPGLARIVLRALAHAPDDRYPTAQALQVDLEAFARTQQLSLSTVALGAYMHELFTERIAAWEQAQRAGETLGQHLRAVGDSSGPNAMAAGGATVATATDAFVPGRPSGSLEPSQGSRSDSRRLWLMGGTAAVSVALGIAVAMMIYSAPPTTIVPPLPTAAAPKAQSPAPVVRVTPVVSEPKTTTTAPLAVPVERHQGATGGAQARVKREARTRAAAARTASGLKSWDPDSPVPP